MRDTPAAVERKFRQMLLKRSGAERLKMGCSMYATARALAKAALLQEHPNANPAELKRLLFLLFYGIDFEPEERNRIASALFETGRSSKASRARLGELFAPAEDKRRMRVAETPATYRTRRLANRRK